MNRRHFCYSLLPLAASSAQGATIPRPSPDLSVAFPGKPDVLISKYKGKVLALEFLLTTCPHCQKASQAIERVYRELGPRGFQPLGLAINAGADVNAFAKEFNLSFPIGLVQYEKCTEYLQHPSMLRLLMPQLVFVDRKFSIRKHYTGDNDFFSSNEERNVRAEVTALL